MQPRVPEREREHPVEAVETARAPLLVGVEQHLRVAVRSEAVAVLLQLATELPEVVDLAVVGEPGRPVRGSPSAVRRRATGRGWPAADGRVRSDPLTCEPAPSGPRCASAWFIRPRTAGSGVVPSKFSTPAMPHTLRLPSRLERRQGRQAWVGSLSSEYAALPQTHVASCALTSRASTGKSSIT